MLQLEADRWDLGGPLAIGGAAIDVLTMQTTQGIAFLTVVPGYSAELILKRKKNT